jgi:hypothetical protein
MAWSFERGSALAGNLAAIATILPDRAFFQPRELKSSNPASPDARSRFKDHCPARERATAQKHGRRWRKHMPGAISVSYAVFEPFSKDLG